MSRLTVPMKCMKLQRLKVYMKLDADKATWSMDAYWRFLWSDWRLFFFFFSNSILHWLLALRCTLRFTTAPKLSSPNQVGYFFSKTREKVLSGIQFSFFGVNVYTLSLIRQVSEVTLIHYRQKNQSTVRFDTWIIRAWETQKNTYQGCLINTLMRSIISSCSLWINFVWNFSQSRGMFKLLSSFEKTKYIAVYGTLLSWPWLIVAFKLDSRGRHWKINGEWQWRTEWALCLYDSL